jgi:transposase
MIPGPKLPELVVSEQQRLELALLAESENKRVAKRARIVLLCGDGLSNSEVARRAGTSPVSVQKWRRRFGEAGVGALVDLPRAGRPKSELVISEADRAVLERYVRRGKVSQRLALRSRIILACEGGRSNSEVAQHVGANHSTVAKWRKRFVEQGVNGLNDADRPGVPRRITDEMVEALVVKTLETKPKGATHWSTRSMAAKVDMSPTTVSRIWRAFGLKPHRTETFQLSTDPDFIDKVRDVVGLYMNPPDNAIVLSVDEKSQIQALNRTQPLLPLRPGQVERGTPEYQRNGTTTLFAALEVATGKVIGKCYPRHRAAEFRRFLNQIRASVPPNLNVHIIADNYATHKAPTIRAWLAKNPRFHMHFTPTHSSWLNEIEGWFSILTTKQIKRGSHHSVTQLKAAIHEFLDAWNDAPKPFKWTKTADEILANVASFCYRTLEAHE